MCIRDRVLGVGDASGMFPIDSNTKDYDATMLDKFDALAEPYGFDWSLRCLLYTSRCVSETGKKVGEITGEDLTQSKIMDTIAGGDEKNA